MRIVLPALAFSTLIAGPLTAIATNLDAGGKGAPAESYALTEIEPPPEDHTAIKLTGKSANPTPESWFNLRGNDAFGWTGVMITRNVSEASITPFLPDPSKASGAAIVVEPGGGTIVLSMDAQGYRIARWLNERGIAAFVLKYRLVPTPADSTDFLKMLQRLSPPYDGPPAISAEQARDEENATLQDGLQAIRYVRAHSAQWRIAPDRIGIIGFSAGAYGALNVALRSTADSSPNLVAAIYGALPDGATVTAAAPPAFIAAATDDPQVPSMQSIRTYSAWREANIPVELHLFQNGGHGFGTQSRMKSSDQWLGLFDHWLRLQGFEKAANHPSVPR